MFGGISHKLSMLRKKISEDLGYQGPNNPTLAQQTGGFAEWINVNNILTSNNTYASVEGDVDAPPLDVSNNLLLRSFGFSIPQTATIDGIECTLEGYASANNNIYTDSAILELYSSQTNTVSTTYGYIIDDLFLATNEQNLIYGGSTNTWTNWNNGANGTLTPAIINSNNFGLTFYVRFGINTNTAYYDNVRLKVYYTNNLTADLIPNSLNWTNAVGNISASTNTQTISGVDIPITLKLEWSITSGSEPNINMFVNSTQRIISQNNAAETFPLQSVKSGDQIYFSFSSIGSQGTFTVKNASDNDTVLDTFTWNTNIDVTPNAVDWTDPVGSGNIFTNTQTITGIDTAITLALNIDPYGDGAFSNTLYYSKNDGAYQLITYPTGTTVSMSNNDTLKFKGFTNSTFFGQQDWIHVINQSDNDTELDTIYFTAHDVVPNSVDFGLTSLPVSPTTSYEQTITGISTAITLRTDILYIDNGATFFVKINNGSEIDVTSNQSFVVNNNDTVIFLMYSNQPGLTVSYDVLNVTNGNTSIINNPFGYCTLTRDL